MEFDIQAEIKGSLIKGKLKFTDQNIIFKNSKTGKVEQISGSDIELVNFQRFVGTWGLRIFTSNGTLHRFSGFKDSETEKDKVANFFKTQYHKDMLEKELCLKGWNWGTAKFNGSVLSLDVDHKTTFEIPLNNVSQCNTGKNEVTLEFHHNDDAFVNLMEMRFHIPTTETSEDDPVESFYNNVIDKASVLSASGEEIAIFKEVYCLTPRGRYDIKIFQTFFQLHGKTFDYKIPMSTVLRLFLLPHKDGRQMFFVLSLDPPIKQGQTRYHFLVLLFEYEKETEVTLPFSDEELKNKYEDKIQKELSGPVYEVMGKIMKVLINRKITGPGNFIGHSGAPAVSCSFKAAAGYIYPLERGFIYVHKPPIHIRFEEISAVNFARSGGSTRSFDFEIELKSGTVHTFNSIEKEEYAKLFDYIQQKKLHVRNTGKNDKATYKDDFGDSDNENEPDAYLERVKAEARDKDSESGSEEESTDEDFQPGREDSDVAEEFDSNAPDSSSDEDGTEGGGDKFETKQKKKEKKDKKESSGGGGMKKKNKDSNKPKRATTAFMIWMNETREEIKKDNPNLKITEIAKKAGEIWKELKDKSKWEEKASKDKERYAAEMKEYNQKGGGGGGGSDDDNNTSGKKRKSESPTKKHSNSMTGSGYKSKEYISEDDSSSDESEKKKAKKYKNDKSDDKKVKAKLNEKKKSESEGSDDAEDESVSGSGSDDE